MQMTQGSAEANGVRQLVTKSELARRLNVTPGRVSQYLAEGKIYGDAIVGEGRAAMIDYGLARSQLGLALDPVQMTAQMRTLPEGDAPAAPATQQGAAQSNELSRHQEIKVQQAELVLRRQLRDDLADRGIYMRTDEARREWGKALSEIVDAIDQWMGALTDRLSTELKVERQQVSVILRRELRAWRESQASLAQERASDEEEFVIEE